MKALIATGLTLPLLALAAGPAIELMNGPPGSA